MSKGKQWWPLQATSHDVKDALGDFQDRLRQKQWLRKDNPIFAYHVYLREGASTMILPSVNEYMQFSNQDHSFKNTLRVQVLRALSMLLKWQILLKPEALVSEVPQVFVIPSVDQAQHMHLGIVAHLVFNEKTYTLIISEKSLEQDSKNLYGRTKYWVCPQLGDSFKWMTIKTWLEARKKPSFGKWAFGSYPERRAWIETITKDTQASQEKDMGVFFIASSGSSDVEQLKLMNATWHGTLKMWALPEFLDEEAVRAYLKQERLMAEKNTKQPSKPSYHQHKKRYDEQHRVQAHEQEKAYVAGQDEVHPDH